MKPRWIPFPGVFRPRSDSWLLADVARREPLGALARVLELCAGPGLAGLEAAREHGATLTTIDVSRRAAFSAALNGRLNGVRVRALRGDLFEPVRGERFDLIVANPPYLPGDEPPSRGPARAWNAGRDGRMVLDRICAEAPAHLAPGGVVLLVHSEVCDPEATLRMLRERGLDASVAVRQHGRLGPLLQARRDMLEAHGLIRPGQQTEDVFVLRGAASAAREPRGQRGRAAVPG